jgi:hypothetical protein
VDNGSDSSSNSNRSQMQKPVREVVENSQSNVEEAAIEKPKAKFNSLFEQIRSRREAMSPSTPILETSAEIAQDDKDMLYSNYSVDELQTQNYRSELSPILSESITHTVKDVETSDNAVTIPVESHQNTNSFTNLFKDIKSQRKEYGTPVLENKTLDNPEVTTSEEPVKTETKSVFSGLFDQIRSRRNNTDVIEGSSSKPLETPKSGLSEIKILNKQPSASNFYDDTAALFDVDIVPENTCNKPIFLAPNVYCLEIEDNKLIYKVNGLKHEVELTENDFESLLHKDVIIEKSQTK